MKIATWNVNGIKSRIDNLCAWLEDRQPDVVCLQELKSLDDNVPRAPIERLGYNVATHGQKSFNGVAILSKRPLEDIATGLPGDASDEQARYIEATVSTDTGAVRIASLYLPNGNPLGTQKFDYKLDWMKRLIARAQALLEFEEPFVLAGDYNVIPMPQDARFPENWRDDALFQPQSRALFRELENLGLTDAYRACDADGGAYSFWDYQAGAWQKNNGIRIDHLLLSPQAADRLVGATIDKDVRGWEKPSDHVPVIIELEV
ncbi:MAG: exodeoxyribonuclease III [Rhodobiaceae bacterium]|nr:exodeoxyribonuclease III [Rhodobiaceae bacterium]MCC0016438.1 exodeoxyribonuclease III [Rhodobiaceae bacterium]MCC0041536.1 exodeoxyribonuclease III [Rhodobiaceae bacterium]MCC0052775.1 exodeoxyribonuclease III [Rhodobiaceae bacterium]